jgi:hypothetical protein
MRVCLSTVLSCSFEQAVAEVKTPRLLQFVAHPLVKFTPVQPPTFPSVWVESTYWVKLALFGFLPFGKQAVVISYPRTDGGFAIRDAGHSPLIKIWDHWIFITKEKDGETRYRDEVRIEAGILTPCIWLFAQWFYRHRQRRWVRLARGGFAYGGV